MSFSKLEQKSFYLIAEVGQNHQGNIANAISYIETFQALVQIV